MICIRAYLDQLGSGGSFLCASPSCVYYLGSGVLTCVPSCSIVFRNFSLSGSSDYCLLLIIGCHKESVILKMKLDEVYNSSCIATQVS
jgi:hypothetical protein